MEEISITHYQLHFFKGTVPPSGNIILKCLSRERIASKTV